MKRFVFLWAILLMACLSVWADDEVSFTASAPDAVAVGDQFRLSYTITTQKVRDFRAPSIKGFDVLMGPSRSEQTSMQMINGKTTTTQSITFTYILMANKEGTYTLPGATVSADGNQMVSNSVTIKVLPADQSSGKGGSNPGGSTAISKDNLFITATVNKTSVYEQEAILLTYKIYTQVDLRAFNNVKLPDFKGFHSQEVELPTNRRWGLEHYKGRNYQTTIYRQFVLFPQQTGKLTIDAARFDASIAVATQSIDPFDAFFNGGSNVQEVNKSLFTPVQTIEVKPLPSKPANFSGGVGDFSLSSSINSTNVKTNDAITVKVVISGTGNLKLLSNPEVKFPEDFEIYDPKADNKFRLTNEGLSGSKVIEYLVIPRNAGDYKIPPVEFTYFDVKSKSYKTLKSEEYNIHVEKGEGNASQTIANFTNKEELKVLNEDIRFIKQNPVKLIPRGQFFFGTLGYILWYIIPILIFIAFFIVYRKQIAANANVAQVRNRKANKVAVKRLKVAGKLLADNKKDDFYDEVLKSLWGYVSDKLNMPTSQLSKDNIEEELRTYGVDEALITEFLNVLNNCEFARFAPTGSNQGMDKIYADAVELISKMENSIKH